MRNYLGTVPTIVDPPLQSWLSRGQTLFTIYTCHVTDRLKSTAISGKIEFDPFVLMLEKRGLKVEIRRLIENGYTSMEDLKDLDIENTSLGEIGLKAAEINRVKKFYVKEFGPIPAHSGATMTRTLDPCECLGLTSDMIDREVTESDIHEIYTQLQNWERVATHLGLSLAAIEAIEDRGGRDTNLKRLYALQTWRRVQLSTAPQMATFRVLFEALMKCKCEDTIKQLCSLILDTNCV